MTTYGYDSAGRRTNIYQPDPETGEKTGDSPLTQMEYDAAGNLITLTNPLEYDWTYTYDSRNRRITETQPTEAVISTAYDAVGNVTSVTDALSNVTGMEYDSANR